MRAAAAILGLVFGLFGFWACAAGAARTEVYPTHPNTIVVPFAPGGATDVLPRMLGERLRALLGQSIVIENVSGAGGTIGLGRVARAAADGYRAGCPPAEQFAPPGCTQDTRRQ